MGGICSKSSNEPDNFSTPGRPLGAASQPPVPSSAPVPAKVQKNKTGGQRLGGALATDGTSGDDPRSAAARAAEERAAKSNRPGGKLSTKLSEQKKQTQNQLLNERSEQERRTRDADQGAEARNWN